MKIENLIPQDHNFARSLFYKNLKRMKKKVPKLRYACQLT